MKTDEKLIESINTLYPKYPDVKETTGPDGRVSRTVAVLYIRNDAFTTCDCGKEMALHNFSGTTYSGKCICGKSYKLINNKLYDL